MRRARACGIVACLAVAVVIAAVGLFAGGPAHARPSESARLTAMVSVVQTLTVGKNPGDIIYDPANGYTVVANTNSSSISTISATNAVKTITVMPRPEFLLYNPGNSELYVGNETGTVWAFTSSFSVAAKLTLSTVSGFVLIGGPAYDPSNHALYLPVLSTGLGKPGAVAKISATNAVTKYATGLLTAFALYDPASGDILASNEGSNTISVIQPSTGTVTTILLPSGKSPAAIVYSPKTTDAYVLDGGPTFPLSKGNVTVITSSNTVLKTIKLSSFDPFTALYDPTNSAVYVVSVYATTPSATAKGALTVIGPTNSIVKALGLGRRPLIATYDKFNRDVYVPNYLDNTTAVVSSASTPSLLTTLKAKGNPAVAVVDPASEDVFLVGSPGDSTTKTGVVTVFSNSNSLVATFTVGNGAEVSFYSPKTLEMYVPNFGSTTVSVIK
jgi:YVTN family beta-propeller protein